MLGILIEPVFTLEENLDIFFLGQANLLITTYLILPRLLQLESF